MARAMLGITFRELTPELCKEKEITDLTEGIYVVKVQDQSAAMEADIKEGDIISGGDIFGVVYENELIPEHNIMCPPNLKGTVFIN